MKRLASICICVHTIIGSNCIASDADLIIEVDNGFNGKTVSSGTLNIVTREEIEQYGADSLQTLLKEMPFVSSTMDSVGNGTTGVADIGGFGETAHNNTQVFVNGIRLNNPTGEAPNLNLIPLSAIDKIEIQTASASAAYGHGSVGGAINIITNSHPLETYDRVHTSGASYGTIRSAIEGARTAGNTASIDYAVEFNSSDGYRDHTEFESSFGTLSFKNQWGGAGTFVLTATKMDEKHLTSGASNAATLAVSRNGLGTTLSSTTKNSSLLSVTVENQFNEWNWLAAAGARSSEQEANFFSSPGGSVYEFADQTTEISVVNFQGRKKSGIINSLGYELEKSTYLKYQDFFTWGTSNTDVEREVQSIYSTIAPSAYRNIKTLLTLRHAQKQDRRHTGNDEKTSENAVSLIFERDKDSYNNGNFYLAFDKGYRFANFDENASTNTGDFLTTQTHRSTKIGYNSNRYQISLYQLLIDNEIRLVDPALFQNGNLDQTQRLGLDANFSFAPTPRSKAKVSYSFLKTEITSGNDSGREIPMIPKHTIDFRYTIALADQLESSIAVHSQTSTYPLNDTGNVTSKKNQYTTVGYELRYRLENLKVFGRINNLLNEEYDLYRIISANNSSIMNRTPAAERTFSLGIQYTF